MRAWEAELAMQQARIEWIRREHDRLLFERMMQQNFLQKRWRPCPYRQVSQ